MVVAAAVVVVAVVAAVDVVAVVVVVPVVVVVAGVVVAEVVVVEVVVLVVVDGLERAVRDRLVERVHSLGADPAIGGDAEIRLELLDRGSRSRPVLTVDRARVGAVLREPRFDLNNDILPLPLQRRLRRRAEHPIGVDAQRLLHPATPADVAGP